MKFKSFHLVLTFPYKNICTRFYFQKYNKLHRKQTLESSKREKQTINHMLRFHKEKKQISLGIWKSNTIYFLFSGCTNFHWPKTQILKKTECYS